jgi:hypothetical protein
MCDIKRCKQCNNGIWDSNDPDWIACIGEIVNIGGMHIRKVTPDDESCNWFESKED